MKSKELHEGFYLTSPEDIDLFYKSTVNSLYFRNFLDQYALINYFQRVETGKKHIKQMRFFKKLFYLCKILRCLKSFTENEDIELTKVFTSDYFKSDQKFDLLGSFVLNSKLTHENEYFDFLFRKSRILDVELIDIMLNNNTKIIKIEQEKADNKYRKSYLSNVAHEFKAPIQVLMITVSELSKQNFPKSATSLFKDIENLGNYILILIMDIISFSKEDTGIDVKFERFENKSPFLFAFQILQLLIKHNNNKCYSITPELYIDENVPKFINSDETRIKQLLVNLISNAYKFTLSGKITIKVSLTSSNALFDEILVQVIDTGIGVPEKDQAKLFKQFEKPNDNDNLNRQGTVLGLFICRNIISKIGFNIGYKKNEGHGSTFYFSFSNIKNNEICKEIEEIKEKNLKNCLESYINSSIFYSSGNLEQNPPKKLSNLNKYKTSKALRPTSDLIKIERSNSKIQIDEMALLKENNLATLTYFENLLNKTNTGEINDNFSGPNKIHINNIIDNNDNNTIDEIKNIPDEVFKFYETSYNDSIFDNLSDRFESPRINPSNDKRCNKFYQLYQLVLKYSKHESFEKIYHNFKPYINFLIQMLENITQKTAITNFLIIDDNNMVLQCLKKMINDIVKEVNGKYGILKSYDGIEGLALFKLDYLLNKSIKVIISDQNMSMMNGLEMLNILKKYSISEDNPKLCISSADDSHLKSQNIQNICFLPKPISKKELRKLLIK